VDGYALPAAVSYTQEGEMLTAISDVRTVNKTGEEALVVDECVPSGFLKI